MRKRSLKLGGSTTTPFARTVRSAIARQISLLSTRGGLDGCRRLALRMFQIWTDSQYPCSGCRGQVKIPRIPVRINRIEVGWRWLKWGGICSTQGQFRDSFAPHCSTQTDDIAEV